MVPLIPSRSGRKVIIEHMFSGDNGVGSPSRRRVRDSLSSFSLPSTPQLLLNSRQLTFSLLSVDIMLILFDTRATDFLSAIIPHTIADLSWNLVQEVSVSAEVVTSVCQHIKRLTFLRGPIRRNKW